MPSTKLEGTEAVHARNTNKSLKGSAGFVAAGRVFSVAGLILLESLLASRLTTGDFGKYLIHFSAATALSMVFALGLHRAIPRDLKRYLPRAEFNSAIASMGRALWVLSIIFPSMLVVLLCMVQLLANPLLSSIVLLGAALALQQILAETLRGFEQVALASFYAGPAGGPLFVFLALLAMALPTSVTGHVAQIFYIQCCAAWLVLIPGLVGLIRVFRSTMEDFQNTTTFRIISPDRSVLADYLSLMLAQVTFYTCTQVDLWIAPFLMDDQQVARYASPRRLVMLTSAPLQLINMLVVTRIPELLAQNRSDKLQKLLRKTAMYGFLPGFLVLLIFVSFPQTVLSAIYGAKYSGGAAVLQTLAIAQMFNAWTGSCGLTLMMSGRQQTALAVNITSAVSLLAVGWLANVGSPLRLAWLSAAVVVSQYLFLWLLTWRLVGVRTDAGLGAVFLNKVSGKTR